MLKNFKEIEDKAQERLLVFALNELKDKCKRVIELKEEVTALLSELGMPEKEAKSVLDWINSLPDVQMSEQRKPTVRSKMRERLDQKRKQPVSNTMSSYSVTWTSVMGSIPLSTKTFNLPNFYEPSPITICWTNFCNTDNWIRIWEDLHSEI